MKRNKITLISTVLGIVLVQLLRADYPVASHRYLADPGALVSNGRVYLYCSNDDENPVEGGYKMASIVCVSSSDLKNWTDHGKVFEVPLSADWAERSWAPSPAERDGKFYLYFGNGGNGIGVAVADQPTGPFKDAIGGRLVNWDTPGVQPAENMWLFDPMTFIDDDGQAYLYCGGNGEDNVRVFELNDDMVSLKGPATSFHVPYFFEASWMHKHDGKYYFSYSTNPQNGIRIDYMIGNSPLDGFEYGGVMSPQPPKNDNNNHHAVFRLKGDWYQAYHNRIVANKEGIPTGFRRNLCVDALYHNEDGSMEQMVNTLDGVTQVQNLDPFQRVEAETFYTQQGVEVIRLDDRRLVLSELQEGDWVTVSGVDFGVDGASQFTVSARSAGKGGVIELRSGAFDGPVIGVCEIDPTDGDTFQTFSTSVTNATGVTDLCLVFKGTGKNLFDLDCWKFE